MSVTVSRKRTANPYMVITVDTFILADEADPGVRTYVYSLRDKTEMTVLLPLLSSVG